ncbi:MAG: class I SAM-dependent methyltransferase [Chloroflexi bacterium]|nr:class I SAM-dependent methyltransferase [Chloroflexota bacterium]
MSQSANYSEAFYRQYAQRYAEVSHNFIQSVYIRSSHPALKGDTDLLDRLQEIVPDGSRGLDAGCGAGARDVFYYWQKGYDILGVDAVEENIEEARRLHPEIADRVTVADLRQPLDYPDHSFDFVMCNAVIQHIAPDIALSVTIPEFARLLKSGGVLQLMFKNGDGTATIYDRDYGTDRTFQLYDADEVIGLLAERGLSVIPAEGDKLGGVMYFTDPKPMDHCVFFARKEE